MSSVTPVPETTDMTGEELSADDAWRTVRGSGWSIWTEAFARFRALGLQLCLAFIPLVIAVVGLSGTLATERIGQVLRVTLVALSPGASDDLLRSTLAQPLVGDDGGAEVALWTGLIAAGVTLITAMGQVERGANRIYGMQRDRPGLHKYARATVMTFAAGLPAMLGFGLLISGSAFGEAVEQVYGLDDDAVTAVALPVGVALLLVAVTTMLRRAPRRRQPGWSWLGLGAVVALVLWLGFTGLLVGYVSVSAGFGAVYGPLTGVIALLLWAQLTSVAIFYGLAPAAQLEALRAGLPHGAAPDPMGADDH
ncbi:MAG: YihY/virulence factor BrkB family protein [Pseudonocardia sp.]|nr:YihY/virulence factor BrkB family protein [Pseudonocardia sp.]